MSDLIDEIFRVFREQGAGEYLGERVSMTEQMLQSAYAAEQDGAPPRLVAARCCTTTGTSSTSARPTPREHGIDTQHEEVAHAFLGASTSARTSRSRSVCTSRRSGTSARPTRRISSRLSPASSLSLELQGGPYSPAEVAAFEVSPMREDAVRLRRWDDLGKIAGLETPDLEHYRPVLVGLRAGLALPPEALVLALGAAVIHAGWNLLLAGARDSQAFAAVALLVSASPARRSPRLLALRQRPSGHTSSRARCCSSPTSRFSPTPTRTRSCPSSTPSREGSRRCSCSPAPSSSPARARTAAQASGVSLVAAGILLVRGCPERERRVARRSDRVRDRDVHRRRQARVAQRRLSNISN